ncbi:hypothetical protein GCWU000325_00487, partial [Alloprevotella tannerae ATCC 51259]
MRLRFSFWHSKPPLIKKRRHLRAFGRFFQACFPIFFGMIKEAVEIHI